MSINSFKCCLSELLKKRKNLEINIEPIYQYLASFKSLIFLLKNQNSLTIENLLLELSKLLELKKMNKNELIFQQGDEAENFCIILKGNVKVLKLRPYEYYMTNEEYISLLLDLRLNDQMEIIHQSKRYNNLIYPINENFDNFVKNLSTKKAGGIYLDMQNLINKAKNVFDYIKQEEETNQKKLFKLTPKDYIKKCAVSSDIIYNTEIINNLINEKITDENEIDKIKLLMKDRKKVIIPNYIEFIELSSGNTFGDLAFENHSNVYQSSIISLDSDGYLGYINKKKYFLLMHEAVSKRNKKIFYLLVYFSFLKKSNLFLFERKYLGFFHDKVFDANYELFKEGEESDYTYFISEGEFELSINKSIIEVNEMIINYKKILKKLNDSNKIVNKQILNYEEEQKQNNNIIINKKYRSDDINELLLKKRYIKLNIIHKKDILGLSDVYSFDHNEDELKKELLTYTILKRKCLVTCKCLNSNSHAFYIPNSIFNNLYYHEGNINNLAKNMECEKIYSIIERLQLYKKSVFDLIKKTNNKFSNQLKLSKKSKIRKFNKNILYTPKIFKNIMLELKESKDQQEKITEKSQKKIQSLKYDINLNLFKSFDENNNKENKFPSIFLKENSKKNCMTIKKRNKMSNIFNNNEIIGKTSHEFNLRKNFMNRFLYENLFYNCTIKKNINNKNKIKFFNSCTQTFNNRYSQTMSNDRYKTININSKNNCISLKNPINENEKFATKNNKKNLIGSYDLLAFEKFNKLFSSTFSRQMSDSITINSKSDL